MVDVIRRHRRESSLIFSRSLLKRFFRKSECGINLNFRILLFTKNELRRIHEKFLKPLRSGKLLMISIHYRVLIKIQFGLFANIQSYDTRFNKRMVNLWNSIVIQIIRINSGKIFWWSHVCSNLFLNATRLVYGVRFISNYTERNELRRKDVKKMCRRQTRPHLWLKMESKGVNMECKEAENTIPQPGNVTGSKKKHLVKIR